MILFLVIYSLFLTYTAISAEQISHTDSLSAIKWGTRIDDFNNIEFVKSGNTSKGEIKIYRNTDHTLNYFRGVKLSSIEYGFNNNKLYFVALKTKGINN